MIQKVQKPSGFVVKSIKVVIGLELLAFAATYLGWTRVNSDRDTRFYLFKNYNWILENYYKVEELLSKNDRTRQIDLEYWRAEGKL